MRKIVLMGRSECGKTTLTQALKGEKIQYHKTQYVNNFDVIIDTPGEYAQTKNLGYALALYAYEADVVGLLLSSTEPYSLYPPCCTAMCNREVIGIVTKIHDEKANVERAERWLKLAGCKKIFYVDSKNYEGVPQILEYLKEEGDILPWEMEQSGKNVENTTKTTQKQVD
jgi:ethanolamine utilization protein EutP